MVSDRGRKEYKQYEKNKELFEACKHVTVEAQNTNVNRVKQGTLLNAAWNLLPPSQCCFLSLPKLLKLLTGVTTVVVLLSAVFWGSFLPERDVFVFFSVYNHKRTPSSNPIRGFKVKTFDILLHIFQDGQLYGAYLGLISEGGSEGAPVWPSLGLTFILLLFHHVPPHSWSQARCAVVHSSRHISHFLTAKGK